jgi:hypothetical protein
VEPASNCCNPIHDYVPTGMAFTITYNTIVMISPDTMVPVRVSKGFFKA